MTDSENSDPLQVATPLLTDQPAIEQASETDVKKNTSKVSSLEEYELPSVPANDQQKPEPEPEPEQETPPSPSSLLPSETILQQENDILITKYCTACQLGDLPTVIQMIESQVIELGEDIDNNNVSGLHWASINNRLSVVKYLISKGVEVDRIGGELNATPLHWACRYGLVYIVDYLIREGGADPTIVDSQGFNCLHLAINSSNIMLVIYVLNCLNEQIQDVDCVDPNDRTALHWAAYQGDYLSVEILLKHQASVKKLDSQGFTPLHWSLIRGSKECIKKLIEEGSDIRARTNDGKDCFDIAKDMNTTLILTQALYECGFDELGNPLGKYLTNDMGKIVTFLYPYLVLGLLFQSLSQLGFVPTLILLLIGGFATVKLFQRVIFPSYVLTTSNSPVFKSPLLAGVFSGTSFWIIVVWMWVLLPYTFLNHPLLNLVFLIMTCSTLYCFQRSMFRDPGIIEPITSTEEIQGNIRHLLATGNYDSKSFCIHTFILKPLRCKFSHFYQKCVARFDHSCPWVYNDIGLRNHKVFMFFVVSLWIDIAVYLTLVWDYYSDMLVQGFMLYLSIWASFQFVWVSFLLITQLVQISKGVTTLELSNFAKSDSNGNGNNYYSSVPSDLNTEQPQQGQQSQQQSHKKKWYSTICVLTGLDQFILTLRQSLGMKNGSQQYNQLQTDYGLKQNCIDFWFATGDSDLKFRNLWKLPIKGESNLNGVKVDYYKLFELPEKSITYGNDVV
ncbi:hypothetical protein WICPIJ_001750 [Wickerhamomyces pijperi]|uniref:Palmitoyltransferase n=1 Tax=Wickerhamomyces pijperi TaxID=599730 RepID=A0A9P8QCY1_WICPI|nr:hypothetical protein WICPIJ_001750 [Wickerhamomyces pijperi]